MFEGAKPRHLNTMKDLALHLGVAQEELKALVLHIDRSYSPPIPHQTAHNKIRFLYKPKKRLKTVQRLIHNKILSQIPLPASIHCYRKRRSIVTNAREHIGQQVVAKLDIKDFFPSVRPRLVYDLFTALGCAPDVARLFTKLTTYQGEFPQGAPTSPMIANLILAHTGLQARLKGLCDQHGFTLTIYGDDITVSGRSYIEEFMRLFCKIVQQCGFSVKLEKVQFQTAQERQIVTGVVVNKKPNIKREDRRQLRAVLHRCQVRGPSSVVSEGESVDQLKHRLRGKISYAMQVNPALGKQCLEAFRQIDWSR